MPLTLRTFTPDQAEPFQRYLQDGDWLGLQNMVEEASVFVLPDGRIIEFDEPKEPICNQLQMARFIKGIFESSDEDFDHACLEPGVWTWFAAYFAQWMADLQKKKNIKGFHRNPSLIAGHTKWETRHRVFVPAFLMQKHGDRIERFLDEKGFSISDPLEIMMRSNIRHYPYVIDALSVLIDEGMLQGQAQHKVVDKIGRALTRVVDQGVEFYNLDRDAFIAYVQDLMSCDGHTQTGSEPSLDPKTSDILNSAVFFYPPPPRLRHYYC